MKKVSIVVGVRNRKENLLKQIISLKKQTFSKKDFELIVVDYGGSDSLRKEIKKICDIKIKYVFVNTFSRWNEARAKNIGIRHSEGDFIICTNADILFEKDCLKKVYNQTKKNSRKTLFQVTRWEILKDKSIQLGDPIASGDFQASHYENWNSLKGYDESMVGWGGIDPDLKSRARRKGITVKQLSPNLIKIYHAFHETKFNINESLNNFWRFKLNYFYDINPLFWGNLENEGYEQITKIFLRKILVKLHKGYHHLRDTTRFKIDKRVS